MNPKLGLVYLFTGEGKGKTSAALGVAVRAGLSGMRIAWISWYKDKSWPISEKNLPKKFKNIEMYWLGKGFYIKTQKQALLKGGGMVFDQTTKSEHRKQAQAAFKKAEDLIKHKKHQVIILDEVVKAAADGLVSTKKLIELINKRGRIHLILTGREASDELVKQADLVTEMRKVKHPYDSGVKAVKGLDF